MDILIHIRWWFRARGQRNGLAAKRTSIETKSYKSRKDENLLYIKEFDY